MTTLIYHVTTQPDWQRQATEAVYRADSLETEGFIHLSQDHQVAGVLDRYYHNVPDRLLLHVDPDKLTAELKYEPSTDNELFPHLYGPIDKVAIVEVEKL
ncbi:DUF952 domain-containing protein [Rudanella paleaurantiibacter]|uniref:DUF952 domain-containing protein n=1 Tax=Rudanella paleaurantiibacter TaxID=2614655 RepID=A0A7J5U5R3_9BACT|nr:MULTISPECIES: DUF952 domain-containing protein [Rudanella]KAB7732917.1 DUF952 domain-containing protein [Rudanella paleaurantiibacter]